MPAGKRSHPDRFVEVFLNTDPQPESMLAAVAALKTPPRPKEGALIYLHQLAAGLASPERLDRMDEVYRERSNVDLHLLFLIAWWRALTFVRPNVPLPRMEFLRERVFSLVGPSTPPEIVCWARVMRSVTQFFMGDAVASLEAIDGLLGDISSSSPHFRAVASTRRMLYMRHGMRCEVERPSDAQLPDDTHDGLEVHRARALSMGLMDGAIRGDLALLRNSEGRLWQAGLTLSWFGDSAPAVHTLRLMGEREGLAAERLNRLLGTHDATHEPAWVSSSRCLLQRRPAEALQWARRQLRSGDLAYGTGTVVGFDAYALIRAELSAGHGEAAGRLLEQRRQRGSCHYVDDLFHARVALLGGNRNAAAEHLAGVMEAVHRHSAAGRLNFELDLSCETTPADLLELVRSSVELRLSGHGAAGSTAAAAPKLGHYAPVDPPKGLGRLVYASDAMTAVGDKISQLAAHEAPVLVTGETGTGKELVARALHEAGPRATAPFVAINCSALPDTLIESELFGHRRGAFTGAQVAYRGLFREAGKGTLFLDEIGDISPKLQLALLRVLETNEVRPIGTSQARKVHCRVVAATHTDLQQQVKAGTFRQDLFYRLERLRIHLPALRERPEDITALALHFLNLDRAPNARAAMAGELRDYLLRQAWPGNARELRNLIERMRAMRSDKLDYQLEDLEGVSDSLTPTADPPPQDPPEDPRVAPLQDTDSQQVGLVREGSVTAYLRGARSPWRRLERLQQLFVEHGRLKTGEVARILGVSRATATRYLKQLREEGLVEKVSPTASPSTDYYRWRSGREAR